MIYDNNLFWLWVSLFAITFAWGERNALDTIVNLGVMEYTVIVVGSLLWPITLPLMIYSAFFASPEDEDDDL